MHKDKKIPVSSLSFEEAMKELESIVQYLESGDLSLEEALELFNRGVILSSYCASKLEDAEGAVKMLMKDARGNLQEVPFDVSDNKENDTDEF